MAGSEQGGSCTSDDGEYSSEDQGCYESFSSEDEEEDDQEFLAHCRPPSPPAMPEGGDGQGDDDLADSHAINL